MILGSTLSSRTCLIDLSHLLHIFNSSPEPYEYPNFWGVIFFKANLHISNCPVLLLLITSRNEIKSYGKFAIFSKLKIEGGWVKRANFGKIKTKDRNCYARNSRDFGKIRLKIEGGGVSRGLSLVY